MRKLMPANTLAIIASLSDHDNSKLKVRLLSVLVVQVPR